MYTLYKEELRSFSKVYLTVFAQAETDPGVIFTVKVNGAVVGQSPLYTPNRKSVDEFWFDCSQYVNVDQDNGQAKNEILISSEEEPRSSVRIDCVFFEFE